MKSKIIKYKWYILTIFIFIISSTIFDYYIDYSILQLRKEYVLKSLHGRIVFLKSGSRGKSEFQLNSQNDVAAHYLERDPIIDGLDYNMYQIAEVGDSIAKDTNTAYLKLIKKNGEEIWFKMVEH